MDQNGNCQYENITTHGTKNICELFYPDDE